VARDQLVNEALELEEAARLKITISNSQVDDAYLQVARNLKMSPDKLTQILNGTGAGPQTLRNRLKATLAWNQITQMVIVPRVQLSDLALEQKARSELNATNSWDYVLKEVTFLASGRNGSSRMGQANAYRAAFKGCDSAVDESLKFTDAAVTDVGRRNATQLPPPIAQELAKLNVGGITRPHPVQNGVSMLAVCGKEAAHDTTFLKSNLKADEGNAALKTEQDKYLADLKAKAKIVNH
jgi:peptidyl-prolyl cis-trans isomerase SurA